MFGDAERRLRSMKTALDEAIKALSEAAEKLTKLRAQVRRLGEEPEA